MPPLLNRVQRQLPARLRQTNSSKLLVSHRPDLAYREHVAIQSVQGVLQAEIDNYTDYAKVYRAHVWVKKAIGKIAENFAPLPVRVVDADGEPVAGHPVTELFVNANDQHSQVELWEAYVVHKLLGGESFFEFVAGERSGQPVEVWPRRPDMVGVVPDASEERKLYPRVAHYTFGGDDAPPIEPEWMWHDRFYNPLNAWRGLAPIVAVRNAIVIDLFAAAWSKLFLKQGARPDFAVIAPEGLTPTEKQELEHELLSRFMGPGNWHKPIILEKGIEDVKPISYPPTDVQWLEQRRFARDEIGAIFGVPDEVMGYGRDTYENMDAAHKWFWLLTLVPMINGRDHSLTKFFTKVHPMLQPGETIRTDTSTVQALQENIAEKMDTAKSLFSMGVPFNIINERLGLGIGDIDGGDTGYLPLALLPTGSSAPAPVAGQQAAVEFGSAKHAHLIKVFERRKRSHEKDFQRKVQRLIQDQQLRVLRALRSEMGRAHVAELVAAAGTVQGNGKVQNPLPDLQAIFNARAEAALFAEAMRPDYEIIVDAFGAQAIDDLGIAELGDAWDIFDPAVQQMVEGMTFKFADDINATTQQAIGNELRDVLDQVVEQGLSIPDAQRLIHDQISQVFDVRKSAYETERIARTEVNRASNQGTLNGWMQSEVVQQKSWLAGLDERTRDSHLQAHNQYQAQPIPLAQDFQVGACSAPAPGASGCPGEDINCRCSMIAILGRS